MITGFIILGIVIVQFIVMIALFSKNNKGSAIDISQKLVDYTQRLEKNEAAIRDEFGKNREETNKAAKEAREELASSLKSVSEQLSAIIGNFTGLVDNKMKDIHELLHTGLKNNREELSTSLRIFEEKFSAKIEALTKDTTEGLEKSRETIEKKLADLQQGNEKKLDEMRHTVDEKLHKTLETRLGESFKLVSERLENEKKSLGEMQTLANDVGSIKNVLSNVKNKGVLGEYQLGAILEQVLTPNQYEQSVRVKEGSRENVEFAVKIPSKEDSNKIVWLPIDAKFPTADYEVLLAAYESGDKETVVQAQKELKNKIEKFAKEIKEKYIDPPNTTEFGIMFLPFEGLYAEVLRIPGLFETIQNSHKVTITGPTTISAFLNSLQMGFRSLAVEKRTSEVWDLLGAVRTEFGKFGDVLQKTKEKLDSASKEIDRAGVRSRAIERKLTDVQNLPEGKTQKLLTDMELGLEE
jgi:DNA recombination protein RmuC